MTYTEISKFSGAWQNSRAVWRHSISYNRYIPWCSGQNNFPLLSVGWYRSVQSTEWQYILTHSNKNTVYITSTGIVFFARWVIPLVTIPRFLNRAGLLSNSLNSANSGNLIKITEAWIGLNLKILFLTYVFPHCGSTLTSCTRGGWVAGFS